MEKKTKLVKDNYCFMCGNHGFPDKVYESCGMEPINKSLNLDHKKDTDSFVTKIDAFGVPDKYRGIVWDSSILKHEHKEKEEDFNFQRFVSQLQKVNNIFADGKLSAKSAIIIAPASYSKMVFAYSCMQRALDHGFTVSPLLDTIELKRLLLLAAENPTYKMYKTISYDDYIMSDIAFVTVTKMRQHEWAFETIQEIIDRRARKGLSTFILSRYDLDEISRRDYSNQFEAMYGTGTEDTFKYPAVIRYVENFK